MDQHEVTMPPANVADRLDPGHAGVMSARQPRVIVILACILLITGAHWWTPRGTENLRFVHILLRKLYLLPVVLTAVWFSVRASLLVALAVTALYLPHVALSWHGDVAENLNQLGEIGTIWIVAVLAGALVGRERRALTERALAYQGTIRALIVALDARERDTERHSERVCAYALRIADELGLDGPLRRSLSIGALLHDVGKIGVPDHILLKRGPLSGEEWTIVRRHPDLGVRILESAPFPRDAILIVRHHHERFDGTGYPCGLAGKEIPLGARIFAVADVFDALTSVRPYRQPISIEAAQQEVRSSANSHFDPNVVNAFLRIESRAWTDIRSSARAEPWALMDHWT